MTPTTTTVQALLNVLVGREPNEQIIIDNNQLRVVSTVNLLDLPQESTVVQDLKPVGQPPKAPGNPVVKQKNPPKNRKAWKPDDLQTIAVLKSNGASFEDIGKVFGRSAKAIQCQLQYMKAKNGTHQIQI